MPPSFVLRVAPFAFLLVLLVVAGCAPTGYGVRVPWPDERVVVERSRPSTSARSVRVVRRVENDAARYARDVRRVAGLTPRQERAVRDVLTDRTLLLLERTDPRDHPFVYPFPRRGAERDRVVARWWRDSDRAVERLLDRRQRRAYQEYVRALERPERVVRRGPPRTARWP